MGWPNRERPFLADWLYWLCPVRLVLKNNNSSTNNQKIGDLFCPVHISGLSHNVKSFWYFFTFTIMWFKFSAIHKGFCCVQCAFMHEFWITWIIMKVRSFVYYLLLSKYLCKDGKISSMIILFDSILDSIFEQEYFLKFYHVYYAEGR